MNKISLPFQLVLGIIFISLITSTSLAEDVPKEAINKFNVLNDQVSPKFKTLFLTQEARLKIDKQREAYLNPPVAKKEEPILPIKKSKKPQKKRIYIPPKVAISAVIIKPDGSTLIRVNNKYNKSPSKHINLDQTNATSKGVPITVNGKTKIVPVGSTLLTRKNKLIDTYKIDAQARKKVMPKTEQKAVKETLKQVQILSAPAK